MARQPLPTDYQVTVEGIGTFTFMRRRMREEMAIAAEYSRMTEGVDVPTAWLDNVAGWIAQLKTLTVYAPSGWTLDLDLMDPEDDETYQRLIRVHGALRAKEASFRRKPESQGEESGASAQGNA
jgi:hypothetical protein